MCDDETPIMRMMRHRAVMNQLVAKHVEHPHWNPYAETYTILKKSPLLGGYYAFEALCVGCSQRTEITPLKNIATICVDCHLKRIESKKLACSLYIDAENCKKKSHNIFCQDSDLPLFMGVDRK